MISREMIEKIQTLKNQGQSYSDISRNLCVSYPSVVKYSHFSFSQQKSEVNKISPLLQSFEEQIKKYSRDGITSSKKIEFLLRTAGYKGSYQLLHAYLKKRKSKILIEDANSYYRIETLPGEQAQVDWGHFGTMIVNGMKVNLYAFVCVLSYSRALYVEFVTNQKQKTLQDCHVHTFQYFGGVPKKIRYDNMKTIVISRTKQNDVATIQWNFEFKNFAKYYGFEPELCPRYYPQSKGKVEAAVKFVRNHFFQGEMFRKTFQTIREINAKVTYWLDHHANNRPHPVQSTTNVGTLWAQEKDQLLFVEKDSNFSDFPPQVRRVSRISMITYKRAAYWVPKEYIQHKVEVREIVKDNTIVLEFYAKDGKIYEHILAPPGSWILPDDRDLIKTKGKSQEVLERLQKNPIYHTKVKTRDLGYYSQLLLQQNSWEEKK